MDVICFASAVSAILYLPVACEACWSDIRHHWCIAWARHSTGFTYVNVPATGPQTAAFSSWSGWLSAAAASCRQQAILDCQVGQQSRAIMQQNQGRGWRALPDPGAAWRSGQSCFRNGWPALSLHGPSECSGEFCPPPSCLWKCCTAVSLYWRSEQWLCIGRSMLLQLTCCFLCWSCNHQSCNEYKRAKGHTVKLQKSRQYVVTDRSHSFLAELINCIRCTLYEAMTNISSVAVCLSSDQIKLHTEYTALALVFLSLHSMGVDSSHSDVITACLFNPTEKALLGSWCFIWGR